MIVILRSENRLEENKNTAVSSEKRHLNFDDCNRISFEIIEILHKNRCTYDNTSQIMKFVESNLSQQIVQAK